MISNLLITITAKLARYKLPYGKNHRCTLVATLITVLIAFCLTPQVVQAYPAASYLPLNDGNSWTYTMNGRSGFTASVRAGNSNINGSASKALSSTDGEIDYFTNDTSGILLHKIHSRPENISGCGNTSFTITASPAITFVPYDFVFGNVYNSSGMVTAHTNCGGPMTVSMTYTASSAISGPETVTTGAGTFQAIKVVFNLTTNYNGVASEGSATYWLASGVGIVKETITNSQGAPETYVLSSTNSTKANGCAALPSYSAFKSALSYAKQALTISGGNNSHVWGVVMNRTGQVCVVAYSGAVLDSQPLGGRVLAASLANTANSASIDAQFFSSGNLYPQAHSKWMDINESSLLIDATKVYTGNATFFGALNDPLVGKRPGGWVGLGGGLALMDAYGRSLGAIGIAGDTPCTNHNLAWMVRNHLYLDRVLGGINPDTSRADNIIYEGSTIDPNFTHPVCSTAESLQTDNLPVTLQSIYH